MGGNSAGGLTRSQLEASLRPNLQTSPELSEQSLDCSISRKQRVYRRWKQVDARTLRVFILRSALPLRTCGSRVPSDFGESPNGEKIHTEAKIPMLHRASAIARPKGGRPGATGCSIAA